MSNNLTILAAVAVLFGLYLKEKEKRSSESMSAFLTGADYNEIYKSKWWQ